MADTEEVQAAEETVAMVAAEEETSDRTAAQEKCTRQPALTVDRKQKSHSSQQKTDQFTAGNASRSTDQRDTKTFIKYQNKGRAFTLPYI
jgi:hypothetical protein